MPNMVLLSDSRAHPKPVFFDRSELNQLLSLYSRRVKSGEWRDYAIDHGAGRATFSVFRHTADRPAYAITKAAGRGAAGGHRYSLCDGPGKLKQGKTLGEVIAVLEAKPYLVFRGG